MYVRCGTAIFGLGYIAFLTLELITILEEEPGAPCYNPVRAAAGFLNIVFVVLQAWLIVYYPRLNLHINGIIDRYEQDSVVSRSTVPLHNVSLVQIWLHAPPGDKPEPVATCCGKGEHI